MSEAPEERVPPTNRPPRPGIRWSLLVIAALLVAFAVVRVVQNRKTHRYLEIMRREGLPVTLDEANTWYAMVPADENSALKFLEAANARVDPPPHLQNHLPVVGKVGSLPEPGAGLPEEMRSAMAEFLSENEEALQAAHEAAKLQKSRYPMDLRQGFNTLLPHLARLKSVSQLLKVEGLYYSDQHKPELAVRSALTSLAGAHSLKNEPLIISQLVRVACVAIALSGLERTVSENVLTDDQLQMLSAKIREAEADSDGAPVRALAGERCAGVDFYQSPPQKMVSALGGGQATSALPKELQIAMLYAARVTGIRDRDLHFYLNSLAQFNEAAHLPLPERVQRAEEINANANKRLGSSRWLFISKQILPSLSGYFDKEASISGHLRATEVALAVERYRLAHGGQLPADLAELGPKYLKQVPEDTFEHEPLEFERQGKGYRIISPGATARRGPGTKKIAVGPVGFAVNR